MTAFREPFPILYVADVERSVHFYCEAFGFEIGFRWPSAGELEFAFLRLDPLGIGIGSHATPRELYGAEPDPGSAPRFELCIYTDDVDGASERLLSLGSRQLRPAADQPWGERRAYFEDPDGNPIHVVMPIER